MRTDTRRKLFIFVREAVHNQMVKLEQTEEQHGVSNVLCGPVLKATDTGNIQLMLHANLAITDKIDSKSTSGNCESDAEEEDSREDIRVPGDAATKWPRR